MNLPNKLTILRIILIPFFVAALLLGNVLAEYKTACFLIALVIFVAASLTDLLDGKIARKYNLITNFGKFADPMADKLLVSSALICFVYLSYLPAWICIVIISREFLVSGLRLVAVEQGQVIAAGTWGKWKTAITMVYIIVQLANFPYPPSIAAVWSLICTVFMWAALVLTIVSMVDYFYHNGSVLTKGGM